MTARARRMAGGGRVQRAPPRRSVDAAWLAKNHANPHRTMVGPVAVRAQSCAEISRPATADVALISRLHQNIAPAARAKLRAAAAGTISSAVTSSTPTAHTENITTSASNPANRYWHVATGTR